VCAWSRWHSWMSKSIGSVAKYLGYVPTEGQVQSMMPLSEINVQDLYQVLDEAVKDMPEDRAVVPSRQISLNAKVISSFFHDICWVSIGLTP
jgi:hypothetical protein